MAMYSTLDNIYSYLYICRVKPSHAVRNHVRRHRRQLHDMTQQELADRVGVTRQTIFSIEKGRYNPSVGLALRIAETFGVPVEALFEIDREYNTVRPHSALGYRPPAPEAVTPAPGVGLHMSFALS